MPTEHLVPQRIPVQYRYLSGGKVTCVNVVPATEGSVTVRIVHGLRGIGFALQRQINNQGNTHT